MQWMLIERIQDRKKEYKKIKQIVKQNYRNNRNYLKPRYDGSSLKNKLRKEKIEAETKRSIVL